MSVLDPSTIEVRDEGCVVVDVYDSSVAIVRNAAGTFDMRYMTRDLDTDVLYVDRYSEGVSWGTQAEAWAYACGYSAGARDNG